MVIDPERCKEPDRSLQIIPVALYLVDDFGSYDKTLIDEMKKLLEEESLNNYSLPVSCEESASAGFIFTSLDPRISPIVSTICFVRRFGNILEREF